MSLLTTAANFAARKLFAKLVSRFVGPELAGDLQKAVLTWIGTLPEDYRGFDVNSILLGFCPEGKGNDSDEQVQCWVTVHEALLDERIPTVEEWLEALLARCTFVRQSVGSPDVFFVTELSVITPHLSRLASKLQAVCARKSDNYRPHILRMMTSVDQTVQELAKRPHGTAIDSGIAYAKSQLDAFNHELAQSVLADLQSRSWDTLSGLDRYEVLRLSAIAQMRSDDHKKAGQFFISAKHFKPDDEVSLCNEVLGFELIGEDLKAFEMANALQSRFPTNGRLLAVWLRTHPENTRTTDLIADIRGAVLEDPEFLMAIVARVSKVDRDDELAFSYSQRLASFATKIPSAALSIAQACHMRSWRLNNPTERMQGSLDALSLYEKAVAVASQQRDSHTQAFALLNMGILKDHLGQSGSLEDYREAARLAPNDPAVIRKYTLAKLVPEHYDEAIVTAEQAHSDKPTPETAHFLAMLLLQRFKGEDCEHAIRLCLTVLATKPPSDLAAECLNIAILAMARVGDRQRAEDLVTRVTPTLTRMAIETVRGVLYLELNEKDLARIHAKLAFENWLADSPPWDRHRLAHLLRATGLFSEAVTVFLTVVKHTVLDTDLKALIYVAEKAEKHDVLLTAAPPTPLLPLTRQHTIRHRG